MKYLDNHHPLQKSLSGLPQINQLTHYEPITGIKGKTGAGKSSLCNALFAGKVSSISVVAACAREPLSFHLRVGERLLTIFDLPGVSECTSRDVESTSLCREQLPRFDLCCGLLMPMTGCWRWMSIFIAG